MQNVTVDKIKLIKIVRKNLGGHKDLFLKAQVGYRKAVIKEIDKALKEARKPIQAGKTRKIIMTLWDMPEPVDHMVDYERVLAMLEMSVEDNIELEAVEFENYVLDKWGWTAHAFLTNSTYSKVR